MVVVAQMWIIAFGQSACLRSQDTDLQTLQNHLGRSTMAAAS